MLKTICIHCESTFVLAPWEEHDVADAMNKYYSVQDGGADVSKHRSTKFGQGCKGKPKV